VRAARFVTPTLLGFTVGVAEIPVKSCYVPLRRHDGFEEFAHDRMRERFVDVGAIK
jgi:hypothetical protein